MLKSIIYELILCWRKYKQKEKATGYFEIEFLKKTEDYIENGIRFWSKIKLKFYLTNEGETDIEINCKRGAFLKTKDEYENISLNNITKNTKDFLIPKKMKSKDFSFFLLDNNRIVELYKNEDCVCSIDTIRGTEIKLRKFSNKDPLGICKKKEVTVSK